MSAGDNPAFPSRIPLYADEDLKHFSGLTVREYFAAKALDGMLANPDIESISPSETAGVAIAYADALIAALNKPAETGEANL